MKNYTKYFASAIREHYPETAYEIISQVNSHYQHISKDTKFATSSKNPIDRRLDFCSYFLALIKTLDEKGESFEFIRNICLEVVNAYVRPKNQLQAALKRIFANMTNTWLGQTLIRLLQKRVRTNSNPEGFIAHIITAKDVTYGLGYGIDILECGICKLFKKHDYEMYASILCEVDEITSALAGLKLIRTGTIANGAAKCDFRFKRQER